MMDEKRGWGHIPTAQPTDTQIEQADRRQRAFEEFDRAIEAITSDQASETNLALQDEYFEFGLDKHVASRYARLLIGGAKQEQLKRLSDTFPFGVRQLHEALVLSLSDKLAGNFNYEEEGGTIDWSAIEAEDQSVLLDERVQQAIAARVEEISRSIRQHANVNDPYQLNRDPHGKEISEMLNHVPTAANDILVKMINEGSEEIAFHVIELLNIDRTKGCLGPELASIIQKTDWRFLRGLALDLFSGLTLQHLHQLPDREDAFHHLDSFIPDTHNWIVSGYLAGWSEQEEREKGVIKAGIVDRLPTLTHLDQSVLAVMRLEGFTPDKAWTATLPPGAEGVTALLELLDDPALSDAAKKSREFIRSMEDLVVMSELEGEQISRSTVRALAYAREKYKVSPSHLVGILKDDVTFLDQPPSNDRTGPAIVTYFRRLAAREKEDAGGPMVDWGAVDTDSTTLVGNITRQIADRIERFGNKFGWSAMLRFGNREEMNYHDAFLCVDALERFATQRPHVTTKDITQLLDQVVRDDAKYDEIPSQVKLRFVLEDIGTAHIEDVLARSEKLNIPSLAERATKLRDDPRFHPYKTWKGMREFATLVDFLNKNRTLEQLANSSAPASTKQFGYALLEHPNVPANEVLKFLTDPSAFLSSAAEYTSSATQERMAPINLSRVERLGLSASEVRDAIADGSLDRLQVLPPFERVFTLNARGADPYSPDELQEALLSALGRGKRTAEEAPEGETFAIAPQAREAKKVFGAVQAIFKRHGISQENRKPWLLGEAMMAPANWTDALAKDLYNAVYDKKTGINAPTTFEVRARIGKKSDPSLVVAGNDTASCMPFGDGKTNVYSWSPACAQMVVERKMADGTWRTMAQSVAMPTLAGNQPAPERFTRLLHDETVHSVFEATEFAKIPVILCDNVEPSPNEVQEGRMPIIETAYRNFFRSYLAHYAEQLGVDATRVVIGKEGYLPKDRLSFAKIDNVFVPLAPISYTDNGAAKSYVIETGLRAVEAAPRSGVQEATGADIMAMAYMEGKGFQDNARMIFGLYDRQQRVTAALISREQHGDPALTLISRDSKGEPIGYMLAYVGHANDVPEVFIDDFAVDRSKNLLAARHASKILDEFLDRYVGHYTSHNEPFPSIYAQMREDTSYKLLIRQLQKLSARSGIEVDMVEEGISSLGGETMHHVRIYVGKNADEVAEAKRRWDERTEKAPEKSESPFGSWRPGNSHDVDSDADDEPWDDDNAW